MGHNRLEQKQGREIGPAAEQKPEEITLARELRGMIDNLLGENSSRFFDFSGSEKASFLDSQEWPVPGWIPVSALISKKEDAYEIRIRGHEYGMVWNRHRGIILNLNGSYPRINEIVPSDSLEAAGEEKRKLHGKILPPEPIPDLRIRDVEIPARDPRLRSRKGRLRYGIFIVKRIGEAASGKKLLS